LSDLSRSGTSRPDSENDPRPSTAGDDTSRHELGVRFDTNQEDVRVDIEVCRRAQRTDRARGVQITRGNALIGDAMDFSWGQGTVLGTACRFHPPGPAAKRES
jgi:hypothetical protein